MNLNNLQAEIETTFKSYKNSGLLDRISIKTWVYDALKDFGQSICQLQEEIVHIKNGQAALPENYHSLEIAMKCNPSGISACEEDELVVQNSMIWRERFERSTLWNSCTPCCKTNAEDKTIIELVVMNNKEVSFFYDEPVLLRLGKSMKKSEACSETCRNAYNTPCDYEISIVGKTLYTNFPEGIVYMQFYGLEKDKDGVLLIPETPKGRLGTYLKAYLKKKVLEEVITNGDDPNAITLLQYWAAQDAVEYEAAKADAKFKTLTPDSYRKLRDANRADNNRIKNLLPWF